MSRTTTIAMNMVSYLASIGAKVSYTSKWNNHLKESIPISFQYPY